MAEVDNNKGEQIMANMVTWFGGKYTAKKLASIGIITVANVEAAASKIQPVKWYWICKPLVAETATRSPGPVVHADGRLL